MSWEDDLMNAAVAYYMQKQNTKTPNFYNAPLSPSEQWKQDQIQKLYGSTQGFVNNMLSQDLNPTGFKFISPMFQGQQFAGGIKARPPFGAPGSPNALGDPTTQATQHATPFADNPNVSLGMNDRHQPFNRDLNSESAFPMQATMPENNPQRNVGIPGLVTSSSPRGLDGSMMPMYGGTGTPGGPNAAPWQQMAPGDVQMASGLGTWLSQQMSAHPELAKLGKSGLTALVTATWGPAAGLIAKYGTSVIGWLVDRFGGGGNSGVPTIPGNAPSSGGGGTPPPQIP